MKSKRNTCYVYCKLCLKFDENFDAIMIAKQLEVEPYEVTLTDRTEDTELIWKRQGWKHNSSLIYQTCGVNTIFIESALNQLFCTFDGKIMKMSDIIRENNGKAVVEIIGYFKKKDYPIISLSNSSIDTLAKIGASLDFDFYY